MKKQAFTIVELLVIIALFSVLASLISPAISKTISIAKTVNCKNQLKQVFIGISLYTNYNDSTYPGVGNDWIQPFYYQKKKFSKRLGDYLLKTEYKPRSLINNRFYYLEELICPANKEIDLGLKPFLRYQWVQSRVDHIRTPFGLVANRYRSEIRPPMRTYEIKDHSKQAALTDVFSPANGVPDTPLHHGFSVNRLFLDGHTQNHLVNLSAQ